MPQYSGPFDSYKLSVNAGISAQKVTITLYLGNPPVAKAQIVFYEDSSNLIKCTDMALPYTNVRMPVLAYPLSLLGEVMNVLRYEKPLYFWVATESGAGQIGTQKEMVGEQEGV